MLSYPTEFDVKLTLNKMFIMLYLNNTLYEYLLFVKKLKPFKIDKFDKAMYGIEFSDKTLSFTIMAVKNTDIVDVVFVGQEEKVREVDDELIRLIELSNLNNLQTLSEFRKLIDLEKSSDKGTIIMFDEIW